MSQLSVIASGSMSLPWWPKPLSHPKRRLPIIMYPSQSAGVSSGVIVPERSAAVATTILKVDPGGYTPFRALLVQAFLSSMSAAAAVLRCGENAFRS